MNINRAWKIIRENMKSSAKENLAYHKLKHNKPYFDECSKVIKKWKQAKLQCLQNPSQINVDNLKNFRRETRRIFRNKKRHYLKEKTNDHETNNKKILKICTEA
jgi:hypothetical protein